MIKIWLVVQLSRNHRVLGVRGVFLSHQEAVDDQVKAEDEADKDKNWPIWSIFERDVAI